MAASTPSDAHMSDAPLTPTIGYDCNLCGATLLDNGTPLPPLDMLLSLTRTHDTNEDHERSEPDLADLVETYKRIANRHSQP